MPDILNRAVQRVTQSQHHPCKCSHKVVGSSAMRLPPITSRISVTNITHYSGSCGRKQVAVDKAGLFNLLVVPFGFLQVWYDWEIKQLLKQKMMSDYGGTTKGPPKIASWAACSPCWTCSPFLEKQNCKHGRVMKSTITNRIWHSFPLLQN